MVLVPLSDGAVVGVWLHGVVVAFALVDVVTPEVARRRWSFSRGYAVRYDVDGRTEYLHRVVMGCRYGDGLEVDHRNRRRLDCRRENLLVTDRAGNAQNLPAMGGSSRFRGVSWYSPRGCWQATMQLGGRMRKLGYRRDEIEAAMLAQRARDAAMPLALPDPELVRELGGWPVG